MAKPLRVKTPGEKAKQTTIFWQASCTICSGGCDEKNASWWAHNHCRHTGHDVELKLHYVVSMNGT